MTANDGIHHGDGARTDDLEARREAEIDQGTDRGPVGEYVSDYDSVARIEEDEDSMEGLSIVSAEDPSLGLTNLGDKGPGDWAADTEESHNPPSRFATDHMTDRSSTLTPKK